MSYHIIHDKQFIKVKDRFICMQLGGDNNLIDTDTGRTSRSWYPIMFNGTLLPTKEDILTEINDRSRIDDEEDYVNEEDYIFSVGLRMGGRSTFAQYKAFYETAIKKAITLEQLAGLNCSIVIEYKHNWNNKPNIRDDKESFTRSYNDVTDETLLIKTYENNKSNYDWVSAKFSNYSEDLAKNARRKYFKRKRKNEGKELVLVDEFYTIMIVDRYFIRNLKYGYKYSSVAPHYKFIEKKEAENKLKKLKGSYPDRGFSMKKIKSPTRIFA